MIRQVRFFFTELDGRSIRVGITRAAAGFASREDAWIWVNPYRLSRHTIAHELVHLLQNDGHVPKGEKSADLYALARHASLADDLPCYLKTPRSFRLGWSARRPLLGRLLHWTARDALRVREGGYARYLRWFEDALARRWTQLDARWQEAFEPEQERLFDRPVRLVGAG